MNPEEVGVLLMLCGIAIILGLLFTTFGLTAALLAIGGLLILLGAGLAR